MATVTLVLGSPNAFSGSWVQWDERSMPANLGDVTALSTDPANAPRYLTRLRVFALNDARVQIQFVEVPGTGISGFATNDEDLSDAWEQYASAITLQYAGAADLVIAGPRHVDNSFTDANDPYEWRRLSDLNAQNAWFNAYASAGRPALTIILDDGETPVTPQAQIRGTTATGVPRGVARVRTTPPITVRIRGATATGVPTGLARVRVTPPLAVVPVRDSARDISLGEGNWRGGASDGTTVWFVDDAADFARAYVAATRVRDSAKDISLGTGFWRGGVTDGTHIWLVDGTTRFARAFTLATRARDASRDIDLETGIWRGGATDGTTHWFVDDADDYALAWSPSTRLRRPAKDINLGNVSQSWRGGASDGTTVWFVDETASIGRAWTTANTTRDAEKDITLGAGSWWGGVSDGVTVWFTDYAANIARAWTLTTTVVTPQAQIRGSIATGVPSGVARVRTTPPLAERIRGSTQSGIPRGAARVRTTPGPAQIRGSTATGVPTGTARVRITSPGSRQIAGSTTTGVPSGVARVRTTPPIPSARIRGTTATGVPRGAARVRTTPPIPPAQIRGTTATGVPRGVARVRASGVPGAPTMLVLVEAEHTTLSVRWNAPSDDGDSPITDYEIQVDGGAWTSLGSTALTALLTGLAPNGSYTIRIRAINARGTGVPSDPLLAATRRSDPPSAPKFLRSEPTGETSLDLAWDPPASDGGSPILHYQVCVIDEDGTILPFEDTDGPALRWRVRGLAYGGRYGFRVRAVGLAGLGEQGEIIRDGPEILGIPTVGPGDLVPLLDLPRQSAVFRFGLATALLRVWWQPSDGAWYGSLEVPPNTPIVRGRRLVVDSGLLDGIPGFLSGNVYCRALGVGDTAADPARDAWRRGTHGLVWEPTIG